jgi:hypothetical protein
MSLARAWRRQLYGASSAALIVPSALLAALVVLALGGGFGQVGVLGQIFAGPPAPAAPGVGAGVGAGPGVLARTVAALPAAALVRSRAGTGYARARRGTGGQGAGVTRRPVLTGGAIAPVTGVAPIVSTGAPAPPRPTPSRPAPSGSAPSPPSPSPGPGPRPTAIDQVVKTIAPVTQQLPAPAGPAVTQVVQAAGSAADGVLPPGVGSGPPPQGLKLP